MTPRRYTLGRRAKSAAATRDAILDAAAAVYREHGVARASLTAIAAQADVARGTILHHFGGAAGLLDAVLDRALDSIEPPDERVLEGATTPEERLSRFLEAMLRFYDRSSDWWMVFADEGRELPAVPALRAREQAFLESMMRFQAAALGRLVEDRVLVATLSAMMQSTLLFTLRSAGLTLDEAIEVASEMLVAVLRRRDGRPA